MSSNPAELRLNPGDFLENLRILSVLGSGVGKAEYLVVDDLKFCTGILTVVSSDHCASSALRDRVFTLLPLVDFFQQENVVRLLAVGSTEHVFYECWEYGAEFQPVSSLSSNIPLSASRAQEIVVQVARALAHFHHHGLLVGKLTSNQIWVSKAGVVRVDLFKAWRRHLTGVASEWKLHLSSDTHAQGDDQVAIGTLYAQLLGTSPQNLQSMGRIGDLGHRACCRTVRRNVVDRFAFIDDVVRILQWNIGIAGTGTETENAAAERSIRGVLAVYSDRFLQCRRIRNASRIVLFWITSASCLWADLENALPQWQGGAIFLGAILGFVAVELSRGNRFKLLLSVRRKMPLLIGAILILTVLCVPAVLGNELFTLSLGGCIAATLFVVFVLNLLLTSSKIQDLKQARAALQSSFQRWLGTGKSEQDFINLIMQVTQQNWPTVVEELLGWEAMITRRNQLIENPGRRGVGEAIFDALIIRLQQAKGSVSSVKPSGTGVSEIVLPTAEVDGVKTDVVQVRVRESIPAVSMATAHSPENLNRLRIRQELAELRGQRSTGRSLIRGLLGLCGVGVSTPLLLMQGQVAGKLPVEVPTGLLRSVEAHLQSWGVKPGPWMVLVSGVLLDAARSPVTHGGKCGTLLFGLSMVMFAKPYVDTLGIPGLSQSHIQMAGSVLLLLGSRAIRW